MQSLKLNQAIFFYEYATINTSINCKIIYHHIKKGKFITSIHLYFFSHIIDMFSNSIKTQRILLSNLTWLMFRLKIYWAMFSAKTSWKFNKSVNNENFSYSWELHLANLEEPFSSLLTVFGQKVSVLICFLRLFPPKIETNVNLSG